MSKESESVAGQRVHANSHAQSNGVSGESLPGKQMVDYITLTENPDNRRHVRLQLGNSQQGIDLIVPKKSLKKLSKLLRNLKKYSRKMRKHLGEREVAVGWEKKRGK